MLAAAVLGIGLVIFRWRTTSIAVQIFVIFVLSWYGIHELSPTKPLQGGIRYMLPMVPFIAVLSIYFIYHCSLWFSTIIGSDKADKLFLATCTLLIAVSIYASYPVVIGRPMDTRFIVEEYILEQLPGNTLVEDSSILGKGDLRFLVSPSAKNILLEVGFAIVSEPGYARFLFGQSYPGQRKHIYEYVKSYETLFEQPYIELSSLAHKFAYHNPDIRIIALSAKAKEWMTKNADTLGQGLPSTYKIQFIRSYKDTP